MAAVCGVSTARSQYSHHCPFLSPLLDVCLHLPGSVPGEGLLGPVAAMLLRLGPAVLCPPAATPCGPPTSRAWKFSLVAPCSLQYLLVFHFLKTGTVLRWHVVVLVCVSLMAGDPACLSPCILAIYLCSLDKCFFRSLACFLVGLLVLYCGAERVLFLIWTVKPP